MAHKPPQETLLSPSNILLYGRAMTDLAINFQKPGDEIPPVEGSDKDDEPPRLGDNNFLQKQLKEGDAKFARIYAFAYEGHYYDLPKPVIFLVHGSGTPADAGTKPHGKRAHAQPSASHTGVAKMSMTSSDDLMVWSYDQADFSMRLDVDSGPFERILLEAMLPPDGPQGYFGGARVSGARVSGARVSGARVSGARVSGARVGGGDSGD